MIGCTYSCAYPMKSPWCNPLWLTGLIAPTNHEILLFFQSPFPLPPKKKRVVFHGMSVSLMFSWYCSLLDVWNIFFLKVDLVTRRLESHSDIPVGLTVLLQTLFNQPTPQSCSTSIMFRGHVCHRTVHGLSFFAPRCLSTRSGWCHRWWRAPGHNHLARHSERGKKTRQTEEEVGRQRQGMDRPGVRQVPEDSREQVKMEETGREIICGAPTTITIKGYMMMMMMTCNMPFGHHVGIVNVARW